MEASPPGTTTSGRWWHQTLQRLHADIDVLTDDFLRRLRFLGGGYEIVQDADLRQTAKESLTFLLVRLEGGEVPAELEGLPQKVGIRRARQGIPRDLLLEAVRLDYRVLWNGLVRVAGPQHADFLILYAESVLTTVEEYISEVQVAFLNERELLVQDSHAREVRAFAALLSAEDPGQTAAEVSAQLRMPVDGEYEVLVFAPDQAAQARKTANSLQSTRHRFLSWDFNDGVLFARPRSVSSAHPFDGIRGVLIDRVPGLGAVPGAAALARRLAPFCREDRLHSEQELWLPLAAELLHAAVPNLRRDHVAGLEALPAEDRRRLVDTFLIYCENGSIKEVASRMYVHRNTVVNRLRAFHECTGLDPMVPVEAARALVALGAPVKQGTPQHPDSSIR